MLPYNDLAAVEAAFAAAAATRSPASSPRRRAGNMGAVAAGARLQRRPARASAHGHGALLIMDEVMTGFRCQRAGWFGLDGVARRPLTFGKVMCGGLPAAAFGGRRS